MQYTDTRGSPVHHSANQDTPACKSCRNRKLRCSRELPSCSRCSHLGVDCHYDYTKNKPGVKVGTIQTLTQRIELLELQLETMAAKRQNVQQTTGTDVGQIRHLVSTMMEEWRQSHSLPGHSEPHNIAQLAEPEDLLRGNGSSSSMPDPIQQISGHKRRRVDDASLGESNDLVSLPPERLIDAILDAYFSVVHPFIPILHEPLFRSRLEHSIERPKFTVVLHAMTVCALRYVANEQLAEEWLQSHPGALRRSRDFVVLSGMRSFSVENIQSLIIIVFMHLCDGDANQAWPLIGTLTRGVVYMGLNVEPGDSERPEACLQRVRCLRAARVWTEAEERRRVFWNVFLLDRFCSFTTGWNMSLSAEDAKVRLPSDGAYWYREEPVITPFFKVWDISMAKMGKSVSFLPNHQPSPSDMEKEIETATPTFNNGPPDLYTLSTQKLDTSTLGAFAYCIEATESLNRIVKFFLQQHVNFESYEEFSAWLTRFKELDLHLIHWKMFLPQRWKDSNISKEPTFVHMDPNLTLAHITHNTSLILLHQCIAYPILRLVEKLKLASVASAETCQHAALETANIVQKYLQYTPFVAAMNAQFAFCTFISARVMLVHAHMQQTDTPAAFDVLLSSLQQMSARWVSAHPHLRLKAGTDNFVENLVSSLQSLQESCRHSRAFAAGALGYAAEVNSALGTEEAPPSLDEDSQWLREQGPRKRLHIIAVNGKEPHRANSNSPAGSAGQYSLLNHTFPTPFSGSARCERRQSEQTTGSPLDMDPSHTVPSVLRNQDQVPSVTDLDRFNVPQQPEPTPGCTMNDLASLSNILLDPEYVDTDRVISFQDIFMQ